MIATGSNRPFDPVAAEVLNNLCLASGAKVVCTSIRSWAGIHDNFYDNKYLFEKAGFDPRHLHPDWSCRTDHGRREDHIQNWLKRHPGVSRYAIIDDDLVDLPNFVRVSFEDGILMEQFNRVAQLLDVDIIKAFEQARLNRQERDQLLLPLGHWEADYNERVMQRGSAPRP